MTDVDGVILLVGATGVVGGQVAELLARHHPSVPVARASRAGPVALDVTDPSSVRALRGRPALILACAQDRDDHLLDLALERGSPLVDIERSAGRVELGMARVAARGAAAPVLFASGWMAGVAALVAARAAADLDAVERIDIAILYALADAAGPQSALYIDHLLEPYRARVDGAWREVLPFTDARRAAFDGHGETTVYRDPSPDHLSLPAATAAATHANRFALDDRAATLALVALFRTGAWRLLRRPALRRRLQRAVFRPGAGAPHRIVVEVAGTRAGRPTTRRIQVEDPRGQTHLTALGALVAAERCLGLDGAPPPPAGAVFPERHPRLDHAIERLRAEGVSIR